MTQTAHPTSYSPIPWSGQHTPPPSTQTPPESAAPPAALPAAHRPPQCRSASPASHPPATAADTAALSAAASSFLTVHRHSDAVAALHDLRVFTSTQHSTSPSHATRSRSPGNGPSFHRRATTVRTRAPAGERTPPAPAFHGAANRHRLQCARRAREPFNTATPRSSSPILHVRNPGICVHSRPSRSYGKLRPYLICEKGHLRSCRPASSSKSRARFTISLSHPPLPALPPAHAPAPPGSGTLPECPAPPSPHPPSQSAAGKAAATSRRSPG